MSRRAAAPRWEEGRTRILFDCRYTRLERHDGVSRYTARLVAELGARHPVVMLISDPRQLTMLPDLPHVLGPSPTSPFEPLIAPRALNRLRPDVVFSPLQTIGPLARRYRLVTTIHDLIYYEHPEPPHDLPAPVRLLWRIYHSTPAFQRWLLRLHDGHVTISETTAQLMRRHRMTRGPLAVIPNGTDHPAAPVPRTPPPTRTILYAGSFMPYKNVDALARAMRWLPGWRLRLLSRVDEPTRARLEALAPPGALDFMHGASDEEYRAALLESRALVTASKAEGFGLPVVEAMALGTPVVVSDIPIFHEVGGDAACYADPDDPEAFARAVAALADDERWLRRSAAAEARSRAFDWSAAGEELLAFLLRIADGR